MHRRKIAGQRCISRPVPGISTLQSCWSIVAQMLTRRQPEWPAADSLALASHFSSRFGHLDVSRVLLDRGENVNARQRKYWTPMHFSSFHGHFEMVKLLLERGADIHAMTDEGETPYQMSLQRGHGEIVDLLRNNGAGRLGERSDKIL